MKLVVKILAVYLFALSLAPCGDGGGGIIKITEKLFGFEVHTMLINEQYPDPCEDSPCSPFCICSSCFVAFDKAQEFCFPEKLIAPISKTIPPFIQHFHSSLFNNSIWQPPKLS